MSQTTQETLELLKAAGKSPDMELAKAFSQSGSAVSGITAYDLEPAAKKLYPVITPLRNAIPRVSGKGGIQANWRGITGINTTGISAGVGGGNRGGVISTTTQDYTAAYKGLGLDDYATFEADYAAEGFDDVKALTVEGLLRSLMIQEERIILGGNNSLSLGTTPTPSVTGSITGGTLSGSGSVNYNVFCVALALDGYLNASVAGGVTGLVTRTNADLSTETYGGGAAGKSSVATATVASGTTGSIAATVAAVAGAVAYAWYWGTAGNELLGMITTINSASITATAAGTQNISAVSGTDYSKNSLVFDGLLTFTSTSAGGSYRAVQATGTAGTGTPLTADGTGGVVEIDAALRSFWDNYRLSPDVIYVSSQEQKNISAKVLGSSSNSAQRFVFNAQQGEIAGGNLVRSYLNKYSMDGAQEIPIKLHPNLPAGTILFVTNRLPYPLSNVTSVLRIVTRREYYQIEWPQRSRKYEYGVYADEVLQNYFPPAFGMITNIANG